MADGNSTTTSSSSSTASSALPGGTHPHQQQQQGKLVNRTTDGKFVSIKQSPNIIHRTTSECIRLNNISGGIGGGGNSGGGEQFIIATVATPPSTLNNIINNVSSRKVKTSSFQITSVTMGTRTSADNGEDSADDLDESHTDDNSRITDLENETPSFSEDTFSKEDVFFSSNAIGTAPVIPTSSQYGLAIVTPELGGMDGHSDVHVSVTDAGVNIVDGLGKHDGDLKEVHHRNERFKVVKIESTEPFRRGRWMCMDYLDHTALQQSAPVQQPSTGSASKDGTADSGIGLGVHTMDSTNQSAGGGSPQKSVQTELHIQNMINTNLLAGQSAPAGGYYPLSANTSPGQTMHQPLNNEGGGAMGGGNSNPITSQNTPSMSYSTSPFPNNMTAAPQTQQQTTGASFNGGGGTLPTSAAAPAAAGASVSHSQISSQQSVDQSYQSSPQSTIPEVIANTTQGQSQPAQFYAGVTAAAASNHHLQGQTLPANILHGIVHQGGAGSSQNFTTPAVQQQPQAMSMGHMPQQQTDLNAAAGGQTQNQTYSSSQNSQTSGQNSQENAQQYPTTGASATDPFSIAPTQPQSQSVQSQQTAQTQQPAQSQQPPTNMEVPQPTVSSAPQSNTLSNSQGSNVGAAATISTAAAPNSVGVNSGNGGAIPTSAKNSVSCEELGASGGNVVSATPSATSVGGTSTVNSTTSGTIISPAGAAGSAPIAGETTTMQPADGTAASTGEEAPPTVAAEDSER